MYVHADIHGDFNKFPHFFYRHLKFSILLLALKIQYVIAIHVMRWLTSFYYFSFKWTAAAAMGIHPIKSDCHSWWISKMQSGREDTLEERYAIKFCFKLEKKKCHRNVWNASDSFSTILHKSSISFWVAKERQGVLEGWWEVWEE